MKLTKHKRLSNTQSHTQRNLKIIQYYNKKYNPLTFRLFPAELIMYGKCQLW